MDQASEVFKTNQDHELLAALKQAGSQGNEVKAREISQQFQEHAEQIQEVLVMCMGVCVGVYERFSQKGESRQTSRNTQNRYIILGLSAWV